MGHSKSVNCVRFDPIEGTYLASGSDDGKIILWTKRSRNKFFGSSERIITWAEYKVLFGHTKEVYDLRWFRGQKGLISGGHDFSVVYWNVKKGRPIMRYIFNISGLMIIRIL